MHFLPSMAGGLYFMACVAGIAVWEPKYREFVLSIFNMAVLAD